jgi:alkylhydroperoxidase/carboxymuconolactone decarboxylase family protein YurZ
MGTARQSDLRAAYIELNGFWNPLLEGLLDADPVFFERYMELVAVPRRSAALPTKIKELVQIALNASVTHLHEPGLRLHIRAALAQGATREEVLEVFQLTSALGIHACTIGVPLLLELLGDQRVAMPLSARQEELKTAFQMARGYWNPFWDGLLELDQDFFEAYLNFSAHPWTPGVLEPRVKELVAIAFDASATHMYVPGLKQHMSNALTHGATADEIMEVLELASGIGISTFTTGMPILLQEAARYDSMEGRKPLDS